MTATSRPNRLPGPGRSPPGPRIACWNPIPNIRPERPAARWSETGCFRQKTVHPIAGKGLSGGDTAPSDRRTGPKPIIPNHPPPTKKDSSENSAAAPHVPSIRSGEKIARISVPAVHEPPASPKKPEGPTVKSRPFGTTSPELVQTLHPPVLSAEQTMFHKDAQQPPIAATTGRRPIHQAVKPKSQPPARKRSRSVIVLRSAQTRDHRLPIRAYGVGRPSRLETEISEPLPLDAFGQRPPVFARLSVPDRPDRPDKLPLDHLPLLSADRKPIAFEAYREAIIRLRIHLFLHKCTFKTNHCRVCRNVKERDRAQYSLSMRSSANLRIQKCIKR